MPPKRRVNVALRTFRSNRTHSVGGFDLRHVPSDRAAMLHQAAVKAARKIDPGLEVRTVETPSSERGDAVKASRPSQPSTRKTFGMPNVSQTRWDAIFGKKPKKTGKN